MAFTPAQLEALVIAARVSTTLSLLGTIFIIVTFMFFPGFNKPINRLIFLASWANVLSDVGTFMSRAGPRAGPDSALCQFQGFLIQWAHPTDMFWILAMAVNVYLVFVKRFDAQQLRRLEPLYILLCYGLTFVPALAYIFIRDKSRGRVYGDATVWCWIRPQWGPLRFATQYGPVWLSGGITVAIYVTIGSRILLNSKQIHRYKQRSKRTESTWAQYNIQVTQEVTVETTSELQDLGAGALSAVKVDDSTGVKTWPSKSEPPSRSYFRDDGAMLSYTRFAGISFLAMIATWIAPSANRTYTLVHSGRELFPLSLLQAITLSSQGLWNAIVYFLASLPACRALWRESRGRLPSHSVQAMQSDTVSLQDKDSSEAITVNTKSQ